MTTKATKKVAMTTTNTTAKAVTKSITVNMNQSKQGLEIRFNFKLSDKQREYLHGLEKTVGLHWFRARQYYWVKLTEQNYEFFAELLNAFEAKGYKMDYRALKGSLRTPAK